MSLKLMATASAMIMAACGTNSYAQDQAAKEAPKQPWGGPVEFAEGVTFDPIIDARIRLETSEQANAAGDATAVTARLRFGGEVKTNGFSFLAEAEGSLAIVDDFNDTLPGNGIEPFSVVPDPETVELNRLQIAYKGDGYGVTVGRQRIILGNSRFVGNVGWRQNEQTFDAIRGTAKIGPVSVDATYSNSQRTIFGSESPNEFLDGDLVLLNAGVKAGPIDVTGFAYLIDYDTRLAFSSQTYGLIAKATIPAGGLKINAMGSYARQSDYGNNPTRYDADYLHGELGMDISGFSLKAGYEQLGSDGGTSAFQTPLATLHKFNGWADLFLTTPANGLQDVYAGGGYTFKIGGLPAFKTAVVYHDFSSDTGSFDYGSEWDASVGFKLGKVGLLVKYANYQADTFGVDTEKLWVQAGISF
ncbi:alginate export family protein [Pontixanthobacter rizhaonensis]|nr:alginate export family protein [Pontixanthobacter rizhaonensis]